MAKLSKAVWKGYDSLNKEGAPAYALNLKERFVTRLMTCLVAEPKFYGDTTQELVDETKLIIASDPLFALKAAAYARHKMYLRTSPLIVLRWLAQSALPGRKLAHGIRNVCTRPDQLVELVSYYQATQESRTLDHGLKEGIRQALSGYSEYQLAKYKGGLSRLIRLTHPSRRVGFQKLIERTLEPPMTWEVALTRHGNNAETWDNLIQANAVPYMALLRNLRNIVAAKSKSLEIVAERLRDPKLVRGSKQFPFRFLAAYRSLPEETPGFLRDSLEAAFALSAENVPLFPGTTVLVADNSGSMSSNVSRKGSLMYKDIANTLLALGGGICEAAIPITFASEVQIAEIPGGISDLAAVDHIGSIEVGGGTELWKVFDYLANHRIRADRVMVFSDMQAWSAEGYSRGGVQDFANRWRSQQEGLPWIHSVDLAGYGTAQFKGDQISLIAGWSDRVLDLMHLAENGVQGLVAAIEAYGMDEGEPERTP